MGKQHINLIYWLSNAGSAISFAFLVILLQEKGISKIEIGLLAIPFSLAMIASNTIFGKLSDDRGRRKEAGDLCRKDQSDFPETHTDRYSSQPGGKGYFPDTTIDARCK